MFSHKPTFVLYNPVNRSTFCLVSQKDIRKICSIPFLPSHLSYYITHEDLSVKPLDTEEIVQEIRKIIYVIVRTNTIAHCIFTINYNPISFYLEFFTHKNRCMRICRTIVSFSNNPGMFNVPKSLLCDNISKAINKQSPVPYIHITNAFTLVIKHIYSTLILFKCNRRYYIHWLIITTF